jgi:hypothetical protein
MLSGILFFSRAEGLVIENICRGNSQWGIVMTPDCRLTPGTEELVKSNALAENPRGAFVVTEQPLADIGR